MATTTNYGWTTPDDTSLVKDGASAIRTLGSAIDTTTKNLNPGTTNGDIDYYATGTTKSRIAIGSSGQCLTVSAGIPSWQPSATSVLTTTGDLLYASAANTLARRAIGSTGDVLTVSGGLPTWATPASGGMTLISTTSLSGAITTISSIPTTYIQLYLVIYGVTNATANGQLRVAPNGTTNISTSLTPNSTAIGQDQDQYIFLTRKSNDIKNDNANNVFALTIYNYASSTNYKAFSGSGVYFVDNAGADVGAWSSGGVQTNTAITSLAISNSGGNLSTGTALLYGVK